MKTGSQAVIWASNENFWQPSVESQSTHPFIKKNIVHVAEFLISWKYFTNFREAGGSTEMAKCYHTTLTQCTVNNVSKYSYLAFFIKGIVKGSLIWNDVFVVVLSPQSEHDNVWAKRLGYFFLYLGRQPKLF